MGTTLGRIFRKMSFNGIAGNDELTRKMLASLKQLDYKMYCEVYGSYNSCDHELVVIGRTSSGDKVEICPICGETKYASYGEKGDLFKGSSKLDLRGQELCFLYPARNSLLFEVVTKIIQDGVSSNPEMELGEFLTTVDESVIADYIKRKTSERKEKAKREVGPKSEFHYY